MARDARHTVSAKRKKARGRLKSPIILAAVEPKGHSMHKNSGILLYWLVLLELAILSLMAALIVPVLQVSVSSQKLLLIVMALGFFFGYVANKLFAMIENLKVMHHVFARLLVPSATMLNIFAISLATNRVMASWGMDYKYEPFIISIAYGAAFLVPSLYSAVAAATSIANHPPQVIDRRHARFARGDSLRPLIFHKKATNHRLVENQYSKIFPRSRPGK